MQSSTRNKNKRRSKGYTSFTNVQINNRRPEIASK